MTTKSNTVLLGLCLDLVASGVVSPLLEELVEILFQQFQEKTDSRCIVFVETRVLAYVLPTYLNQNFQFKEVDAFAMQLTGKNAPKQEYGNKANSSFFCLSV